MQHLREGLVKPNELGDSDLCDAYQDMVKHKLTDTRLFWAISNEVHLRAVMGVKNGTVVEPDQVEVSRFDLMDFD